MRCTMRVVASGAVSGGFDDDGVTREQRVRQGSAEDGDRPVERHDDGDDAERLVGHRRPHGNRARDGRQLLRRVHFVREGESELPPQLEDERIDPGLLEDLAVLL